MVSFARSRRARLLLGLIVAGALLIPHPAPVGAVTIALSIPVGDFPGDTAVDLLTGRVFVPNVGSDDVTVLDGRAATPSAIAGSPISAGDGSHSAAVDQSTGRVFVTNENANSVTVIDGRATPPSVIATVSTGGSFSRSVTVEPATGRVFIANTGNSTVSVLDGRATPPAPISGSPFAVGNNPRGIASDPVTGGVFVPNTNSSNMTVLDGRATPPAPISGSPVSVGSQPYGVVVDPFTGKVFVANSIDDNVSVLDGRASPPIAIPPSPIAAGDSPISVGIDLAAGRVVIGNLSDGTLTVLDSESLAVVETVRRVGVSSTGGSFSWSGDPTTGRLFVSDTNADRVLVLRDAGVGTTADARDSLLAALGQTQTELNVNVDAAESAVLAGVDAAESAVLAGVQSSEGAVRADIAALSSKVGNNTRAFCAEGSVRNDTNGVLQMYVTLFSETSQNARIDYITNKGTFGHDQALTAGVRYTDDANAFLLGPGAPLAGQGDVDASVRVTATSPVFLACPVYFNREIGAAGRVEGGTVQDGNHN